MSSVSTKFSVINETPTTNHEINNHPLTRSSLAKEVHSSKVECNGYGSALLDRGFSLCDERRSESKVFATSAVNGLIVHDVSQRRIARDERRNPRSISPPEQQDNDDDDDDDIENGGQLITASSKLLLKPMLSAADCHKYQHHTHNNNNNNNNASNSSHKTRLKADYFGSNHHDEDDVHLVNGDFSNIRTDEDDQQQQKGTGDENGNGNGNGPFKKAKKTRLSADQRFLEDSKKNVDELPSSSMLKLRSTCLIQKMYRAQLAHQKTMSSTILHQSSLSNPCSCSSLANHREEITANKRGSGAAGKSSYYVGHNRRFGSADFTTTSTSTITSTSTTCSKDYDNLDERTEILKTNGSSGHHVSKKTSNEDNVDGCCSAVLDVANDVVNSVVNSNNSSIDKKKKRRKSVVDMLHDGLSYQYEFDNHPIRPSNHTMLSYDTTTNYDSSGSDNENSKTNNGGIRLTRGWNLTARHCATGNLTIKKKKKEIGGTTSSTTTIKHRNDENKNSSIKEKSNGDWSSSREDSSDGPRRSSRRKNFPSTASVVVTNEEEEEDEEEGNGIISRGRPTRKRRNSCVRMNGGSGSSSIDSQISFNKNRRSGRTTILSNRWVGLKDDSSGSVKDDGDGKPAVAPRLIRRSRSNVDYDRSVVVVDNNNISTSGISSDEAVSATTTTTTTTTLKDDSVKNEDDDGKPAAPRLIRRSRSNVDCHRSVVVDDNNISTSAISAVSAATTTTPSNSSGTTIVVRRSSRLSNKGTISYADFCLKDDIDDILVPPRSYGKRKNSVQTCCTVVSSLRSNNNNNNNNNSNDIDSHTNINGDQSSLRRSYRLRNLSSTPVLNDDNDDIMTAIPKSLLSSSERTKSSVYPIDSGTTTTDVSLNFNKCNVPRRTRRLSTASCCTVFIGNDANTTTINTDSGNSNNINNSNNNDDSKRSKDTRNNNINNNDLLFSSSGRKRKSTTSTITSSSSINLDDKKDDIIIPFSKRSSWIVNENNKSDTTTATSLLSCCCSSSSAAAKGTVTAMVETGRSRRHHLSSGGITSVSSAFTRINKDVVVDDIGDVDDNIIPKKKKNSTITTTISTNTTINTNTITTCSSTATIKQNHHHHSDRAVQMSSAQFLKMTATEELPVPKLTRSNSFRAISSSADEDDNDDEDDDITPAYLRKPINLTYAFEEIPRHELWYKSFRRQDTFDEFYLPLYHEYPIFTALDELYPNRCCPTTKNKTRTSGINNNPNPNPNPNNNNNDHHSSLPKKQHHSSSIMFPATVVDRTKKDDNPRISPRCHASTLAAASKSHLTNHRKHLNNRHLINRRKTLLSSVLKKTAADNCRTNNLNDNDVGTDHHHHLQQQQIQSKMITKRHCGNSQNADEEARMIDGQLIEKFRQDDGSDRMVTAMVNIFHSGSNNHQHSTSRSSSTSSSTSSSNNKKMRMDDVLNLIRTGDELCMDIDRSVPLDLDTWSIKIGPDAEDMLDLATLYETMDAGSDSLERGKNRTPTKLQCCNGNNKQGLSDTYDGSEAGNSSVHEFLGFVDLHSNKTRRRKRNLTGWPLKKRRYLNVMNRIRRNNAYAATRNKNTNKNNTNKNNTNKNNNNNNHKSECEKDDHLSGGTGDDFSGIINGQPEENIDDEDTTEAEDDNRDKIYKPASSRIVTSSCTSSSVAGRNNINKIRKRTKNNPRQRSSSMDVVIRCGSTKATSKIKK